MGDDMPMWKGLFEWSMSYQDGTNPTGSSNARPLSETDRQWLEEALKGAMLDLSNRMQDISIALNEPETTEEASTPTTDVITTTTTTTPLEDKERMLDELMEIVESIDQAKDLSTIGGLQTLLNLLSSPHASLRWRAAEVIATCVQNNPEVQDAFLEGGVLPALWPLIEHHTDGENLINTTTSTSSGSAICLMKGMLAVSCQIRGHPASLQWFRGNNGLKKIISILSNTTRSMSSGGGGVAEGETRVQRKCLQMLEYLLNTVPSDRTSAVTLNIDHTTRSTGTPDTPAVGSTTETSGSLLPLLVDLIASSGDGDIRSAALGVIHQLAGDDACLEELQKESIGVVAAVQAVQCKLDSLPREEWGQAEEEAKLAVVVMEELVRKKVVAGDSGGGGGSAVVGVEAERSASMQLMALPDQE